MCIYLSKIALNESQCLILSALYAGLLENQFSSLHGYIIISRVLHDPCCMSGGRGEARQGEEGRGGDKEVRGGEGR